MVPSTKARANIWVLASGPAPDLHLAVAHAPKPDFVIAADGGTVLADALNITPGLIVGDIDSSPSELVARYEEIGVEVRRYDHDTKWETDTELALLAALEYNPLAIYLFGAIGGRLDHSLANVLLLTNPKLAHQNLHILDGPHQLFLAKRGQLNRIPGNGGSTVTLLPVGGDVVGVKTSGLHWPLHKETLPQGQGRGVSNLIDNPATAAVQHESGQLLVVILHV